MSDLDDAPLYSDLNYEDLAVGDRWGPFVEALGRETSNRLRGALDSETTGEFAPLGVLPLLTLRALRRALRGIIPGGILFRQHFSAVDALPAEGEIEVAVWVSAQHQRKSGLYTTFAFALSHEGRTPALVEWTILAPPAAEAQGTSG